MLRRPTPAKSQLGRYGVESTSPSPSGVGGATQPVAPSRTRSTTPPLSVTSDQWTPRQCRLHSDVAEGVFLIGQVGNRSGLVHVRGVFVAREHPQVEQHSIGYTFGLYQPGQGVSVMLGVRWSCDQQPNLRVGVSQRSYRQLLTLQSVHAPADEHVVSESAAREALGVVDRRQQYLGLISRCT